MTSKISVLSYEEASVIFKRVVRYSKEIGIYNSLKRKYPTKSFSAHLNRLMVLQDIRSIAVEFVWMAYITTYSQRHLNQNSIESSRLGRIEASIYIMDLLVELWHLFEDKNKKDACCCAIYEEFGFMFNESIKKYMDRGINLNMISDDAINKAHNVLDFLKENYIPVKYENVCILPSRR